MLPHGITSNPEVFFAVCCPLRLISCAHSSHLHRVLLLGLLLILLLGFSLVSQLQLLAELHSLIHYAGPISCFPFCGG